MKCTLKPALAVIKKTRLVPLMTVTLFSLVAMNTFAQQFLGSKKTTVSDRYQQLGDDSYESTSPSLSNLQHFYRKKRIVFRFVAEGSLRPPNNSLEWVEDSPDGVLCFEGDLQHPTYPGWVIGAATACARIVAENLLLDGGAVLGAKIRHIISLHRGIIVDDDYAIITPLMDSQTSAYTHGLTATTDFDNVRPELSSGKYEGRPGNVGVNANVDLSQFPQSIVFSALFTIDFSD